MTLARHRKTALLMAILTTLNGGCIDLVIESVKEGLGDAISEAVTDAIGSIVGSEQTGLSTAT